MAQYLEYLEYLEAGGCWWLDTVTVRSPRRRKAAASPTPGPGSAQPVHGGEGLRYRRQDIDLSCRAEVGRLGGGWVDWTLNPADVTVVVAATGIWGKQILQLYCIA